MCLAQSAKNLHDFWVIMTSAVAIAVIARLMLIHIFLTNVKIISAPDLVLPGKASAV